MSTVENERLKKITGIGPKRLARILTKLIETHQTLDEFFKLPSEQIIKDFKLPKNVAEAIANASTINETVEMSEIELLNSKGVKVVKRGEPNYPIRLEATLGDAAPSVLYMWGNIDLLNKPSVGFCGSRNVTEKGIDVTIDTAKQITDLGWVVVSGHARGVDTAAHRTSLENNGSTIIVAPEGMLNFKLRSELKKIAKHNQILIISEFPPKARWTVGNAMTRNKTIIGLSDAMILVEARLEGGTFEAGKAALKLKIPLYVAAYQKPGISAAGNEHFLRKGAVALLKDEESGKANIASLRQTVNSKDRTVEKIAEEKPQQLEMFLPIERNTIN
jgi:DNA processing protein